MVLVIEYWHNKNCFSGNLLTMKNDVKINLISILLKMNLINFLFYIHINDITNTFNNYSFYWNTIRYYMYLHEEILIVLKINAKNK